MKKNRIVKIIGASAAAALFAFAMTACSSDSGSGDEGLQTDTGLTGGVAATVNGTEIEEDKVTRAINNFRISNQLDEESEWKDFLKNGENTVESFRYEVLGQLVDQELVTQCAGQLDITVDDAEIDSYVEKMSSQYSSEEAWLDAVEQAGWDDINAYRDALKNSIYDKKLTEHFEAEEDAKVDDAALLEAVQNGASTYTGVKRTKYIQLDGDAADRANEALAKIRSGEITFEEAVEQYSTDEESKANGGDKGWDKLAEDLPSAYTDAIANLEVGAVSEVVTIGDNLGIITVTDVWTAPENITGTSQVPDEIVTAIRENTVTTKAEEDADNWIDERHSDNDIQITPRPDGLPYWVDMSDVYSEEETTKINDKALQELTTGVEVTEDETAIAEADAAAVEGEAPAAETEVPAAEGEAGAAEGDVPAAEGEAPATEGEATEGEVPTAEGEGEAPAAE